MDAPKSIVNVSGDCFDYVRVFSDGIWNVKPGETILEHSLLRFHLQLLVMISLSTALHLLFKRFHFPRITSEILAGIILGPTVMERFFSKSTHLLFPPLPNQVLGSLTKLGFILFTFLSGVRMDPSLIQKSGRVAIVIGLLQFALPFAMLQTVEVKFNQDSLLTDAMKGSRAVFVDLYMRAMVTSQFLGVTCILMQLKITNSRLGHIALASTLISELLRLIYTTIIGYRNAMFSSSFRVGVQAIVLSLIMVFFIVVVFRAMMLWFIRITPEGKPMKDIYPTVVMVLVLVLSSAGDSVGLYYLFGPFILGLVVPAESPLANLLIEKLDTVVSGLLIPLMSIFCAIKFDLWQFVVTFREALFFQISLVGYVIKLVETFVTILCCKMSVRDAAALTLILNAKGVLEVGIFLSYGDLEGREIQSTSGIFLIFLLASFAPPLVKLLYDPAKVYIGYKKKCIQHASDDTELPILACAYRQEDAVAAIKLLEFSNPTKQSPLSIYGLCLEELVSGATPFLINHQLGQRTSSSEGSRSQPIIDIFKYFKSQHLKLAQVQVFTAVSHLKQMHEDICWLAFNNATAMIILPFHKKWNGKGKMLSCNMEFRNLNINVLERAPCSVAILIDRRRTRGLSSVFVSSTIHRVAVLFIGGADDREALAFALRMAGSPRVELTVTRFVTPHEHVQDRWEELLDNESLRSMKHEMSRCSNIKYVEETVRDGSDTAGIVHTMESSYDLIIVGRRHENEPAAISGLAEWAELPELGPVGDLLASADISSAVSVLVVQQQIMKASHSSILN